MNEWIRNQRILVLDNQVLVASEISDYLEDAGCEIIGPCGNFATATALADTKRPDLVVLDQKLGVDATSIPPAERLLAKKVNVRFATIE